MSVTATATSYITSICCGTAQPTIVLAWTTQQEQTLCSFSLPAAAHVLAAITGCLHAAGAAEVCAECA